MMNKTKLNIVELEAKIAPMTVSQYAKGPFPPIPTDDLIIEEWSGIRPGGG